MPNRNVAVLFDLDGVLIDTGSLHHTAWVRFAAAHGITIDAAFFRETFGLPNGAILPRLFPDRRLDAQTLRELGAAKEAVFRKLARGRVTWLEGARELLAALAEQDVPRGLFTSTPPENLAFLNAELGLDHWLPLQLTAADVPRGKPAPDGWLALAERLQVPIGRCAVLEDAPGGLHAARAAGAVVVALATSHPAEVLRPWADYVVGGPEALDFARLRQRLASR